MKFEILKDKNRQYHFHLKAINGTIVLTSKGYKSLVNPRNGIGTTIIASTNIDNYER